jgi:hypothetical protein
MMQKTTVSWQNKAPNGRPKKASNQPNLPTRSARKILNDNHKASSKSQAINLKSSQSGGSNSSDDNSLNTPIGVMFEKLKQKEVDHDHIQRMKQETKKIDFLPGTKDIASSKELDGLEENFYAALQIAEDTLLVGVSTDKIYKNSSSHPPQEKTSSEHVTPFTGKNNDSKKEPTKRTTTIYKVYDSDSSDDKSIGIAASTSKTELLGTAEASATKKKMMATKKALVSTMAKSTSANKKRALAKQKSMPKKKMTLKKKMTPIQTAAPAKVTAPSRTLMAPPTSPKEHNQVSAATAKGRLKCSTEAAARAKTKVMVKRPAKGISKQVKTRRKELLHKLPFELHKYLSSHHGDNHNY